MSYFMGIDIGSGSSKGVITQDDKVVASRLLISGINYQQTAEKLRETLLTQANISEKDVAYAVATGHGSAKVAYADEKVVDIRCCARGIHNLFPSVRTVIDIQGMTSQVIRVSEKGLATNFVVSEKCAAGSGRFLEVIANVLRINLEDAGPLSLKATNPVTFTTGCAVFGESEAVSRVSEGIAKEDILAGVHQALANKITTMVEKVGMEPDCAVSGGGALNIGLVKSLEAKLGIKLLVPPQPQLVNALGAAIIAAEKFKARR